MPVAETSCFLNELCSNLLLCYNFAMKSKTPQNVPLYEKPGNLDPGRKGPNRKEPDFTIVTHYRNNESDLSGGDSSAEFNEMSANALEPFEDEDLLSGKVSVRRTGRPTGAKAYVTKTFESELESDYETDGHKYKRNSDPMAGGAVPSHAATAFRAGRPSFYSDPVRLGLYSAGLILLICAEAAALFFLYR